MRGSTRVPRRTVKTSAAFYWDDIATDARSLDLCPTNKTVRLSPRQPSSRPSSAKELWDAAENARKTAKRVCSYAAFSGFGSAFSQMPMGAVCAAEWRKVEVLEEEAKRLWVEEQSLFDVDTVFGDNITDAYDAGYSPR